MTLTRRTRNYIAAVVGCVALAAILTATWSSPSAEPNSVEIEYQGELLDAKRKPIGGIYPLEFRLYQDRKSDKSLWRETHWVAIVDGRYDVRLGTSSKLRSTLAKPGARLYLGINLDGGDELLRETISFPGEDEKDEKEDEKRDDEPAKEEPKEAPKADAKPGKEAPVAKDKGDTKYKTESSFAEMADYARRSGKAEDSDKLGGKTRAELEAEIEKLREELSRHRTDKDLHNASAELGAKTTTLPAVGGRGGASYTRECPPGHVVTGIRGRAGQLIDSLQVICSPLK